MKKSARAGASVESNMVTIATAVAGVLLNVDFKRPQRVRRVRKGRRVRRVRRDLRILTV